MKLPEAVHEAAEWQAAMEALILVATLGGPTMFARIGIRIGGGGSSRETHEIVLIYVNTSAEFGDSTNVFANWTSAKTGSRKTTLKA